MRIIGHIDHKRLKITIFKLDNKFAVKFESGPYEQTFKYRIGEIIHQVGDLKNMIDEEFILEVEKRLEAMHHSNTKAMDRFLPRRKMQLDEFDEII